MKKSICYSDIEILKDLSCNRPSIKAVLFDFDGTISTLRQGWEDIMGPFMVEMIAGPTPPGNELIQHVKEYIDESTGIQTIFQMQWLEKEVRRWGLNPDIHDQWWYKEEYNRRLLNMVKVRVKQLEEGQANPEDYLIMGVKEFIKALHEMGLAIYVASGTDHKDVVREATALGLKAYFSRIAGAPEKRADCSKEAVLRLLMEDMGLKGEELLVVGDGKVEIALGVEAGAITLGAATNEIDRRGINPVKRRRLKNAGAHAIVGDFLCWRGILELLFP